jgi:hypothetical protein
MINNLSTVPSTDLSTDLSTNPSTVQSTDLSTVRSANQSSYLFLGRFSGHEAKLCNAKTKTIYILNTRLMQFSGLNIAISNYVNSNHNNICEVFDILEKELILTGLDREELTPKNLSDILKKYKLTSYNNLLPYIYMNFTNRSYVLSSSEYDYIISRFIAFMDVFFESSNNKQFPCISHIIHNLLLDIHRSDIAVFFPKIKSVEKNLAVEKIYKDIHPQLEYACECIQNGIKYHSIKHNEPIIEPIIESLDADKIFIDPLVKSIDDIQTYGNDIIHNVYDTITLLFGGCINHHYDESDDFNNTTNNTNTDTNKSKK